MHFKNLPTYTRTSPNKQITAKRLSNQTLTFHSRNNDSLTVYGDDEFGAETKGISFFPEQGLVFSNPEE
jgi:hypothetical protein